MLWVLLSVVAALIWAVVVVVDKYVLEKWVKNPTIPVLIAGIVGLIASIVIYLLHGFMPLSYSNITLAFFAGILVIATNVLYFEAAKIEEISRVAPLFYLGPLFILILGAIFLGEIFEPIKYLGILLLVVGAMTISIKSFKKIRITKAFLLMTFSSLTMSILAIITKYLLNFADFWTIFAYIRIGTIFVLIPIFYFNYLDFISTVKEHGKKVFSIIFLNQSLAVTAIILTTAAIAIGYVTLVNVLVSIQAFFILLFTVILSIFFPKILKEKTEKSIIITKFIAIVLMFAGIFLII